MAFDPIGTARRYGTKAVKTGVRTAVGAYNPAGGAIISGADKARGIHKPRNVGGRLKSYGSEAVAGAIPGYRTARTVNKGVRRSAGQAADIGHDIRNLPGKAKTYAARAAKESPGVKAAAALYRPVTGRAVAADVAIGKRVVGAAKGAIEESQRQRAAHQGGSRHDRPSRPLPSTRSTPPAEAYAPGRKEGKYRDAADKMVAKASSGGGSPLAGKIQSSEMNFAKAQLAKAGMSTEGSADVVTKRFRDVNAIAARKRAATGAGRASSVGAQTALAAGMRRRTAHRGAAA